MFSPDPQSGSARQPWHFNITWWKTILVSTIKTLSRNAKDSFFCTIDSVLAEMGARFSERNHKYMEALRAVDPGSDTFLNPEKVKPLLDLTKTEVDEAQFAVALNFVNTQGYDKVTLTQLLSSHKNVFSAMPVVLSAFKLALTFGASTAMCENSFSTLKNVFTEHRRSMLHSRKVNLIKLAFEHDLTRKFMGEWKERLLRRFNAAPNRRIQLY